jgi:WD40 repeat protein
MEEKPRRQAPASPQGDFDPVRFKVRVLKDARRKLKGQCSAEWAPDGLHLQQGQKADVLVPVGSQAGYLKGSSLYVRLDERRIEMAVAGLMIYQQRLARDVAAYLNGERQQPDPKGYSIPWYLFLPAFLPLGIPIITLGGAIWGALGAGLFAACLALARVEKLPAIVRVLLALLLSGIGYAIVIAVVVSSTLLRWADQAKQLATSPATQATSPAEGTKPPKSTEPEKPADKPAPPKPLPGERHVVKVGEAVRYMEFAPDGKTLATVTDRQALKLWDPDTGAERFATEPTNSSQLGLLLFSPDSHWVTAWDGRGPVEVRDTTGKVQRRLDAGPQAALFSYGSFSPDSTLLAVAAGERIRFWQIPDGKEAPKLGQMIRTPGLNYTSAQFTPDGKTLLTGAYRGMERVDQVWDLTTGKQKSTLKGLDPKAGYGRLRLSPDGRLAMISNTRQAELLDWMADRPLRTVAASGADFAQVIFTPDSRHLLSLSTDGTVTRWDVDTGKKVASFKDRGPRGSPMALAISADGKTIATTSGAGDLTLWDADKAFPAQ